MHGKIVWDYRCERCVFLPKRIMKEGKFDSHSVCSERAISLVFNDHALILFSSSIISLLKGYCCQLTSVLWEHWETEGLGLHLWNGWHANKDQRCCESHVLPMELFNQGLTDHILCHSLSPITGRFPSASSSRLTLMVTGVTFGLYSLRICPPLSGWERCTSPDSLPRQRWKAGNCHVSGEKINLDMQPLSGWKVWPNLWAHVCHSRLETWDERGDVTAAPMEFPWKLLCSQLHVMTGQPAHSANAMWIGRGVFAPLAC